ncbi:MAG: DUF2271 domain-containing protein [Oscillospiraceae bacterium]|nr:DUF2271 domain-containing protein [Oscillospiraceae bacterium]
MHTLKPHRFLAVILLFALAALPGCTGTPAQPAETPSDRSWATIAFDFQKQSGHASNQFAVWVETADGQYVKTLYATKFTAAGGYKNRPDSIPTWVDRSGLAGLSKEQVDVMAGATPKSGAQSYTWDLTGADGAPVPAGTYKFFVEGSLRWKNRVLHAGEIAIGGEAATATATAAFTYETSPDQPALSDDSPEHDMIGTVTAGVHAVTVPHRA